MEEYKIPANTRIGHVHLKVSDLQKSLDFYVGLLGFELMMKYGTQAAFISAGGYHHHIGLNTWHSSRTTACAADSARTISYCNTISRKKKDLAVALQRLIDAKYPITGASDHGDPEAIYLDDPDGIGVELYWDRPKDEWP